MIFEIWDLKNTISRAETFEKGAFSKNDYSRAENNSNQVFFKKSSVRKIKFQISFYLGKAIKLTIFLSNIFRILPLKCEFDTQKCEFDFPPWVIFNRNP